MTSGFVHDEGSGTWGWSIRGDEVTMLIFDYAFRVRFLSRLGIRGEAPFGLVVGDRSWVLDPEGDPEAVEPA